jgi:hypothetical protein
MEPEGPLPHSQEPATCPYFVQDIPLYKTLAPTPDKNGGNVSRENITSGEGNWKAQEDYSLH